MSRSLVHTITKEDIGKKWIITDKYYTFGSTKKTCVGITDLMRNILPIDIGKRIYLVGEIFQVENQEQLERRLTKEKE